MPSGTATRRMSARRSRPSSRTGPGIESLAIELTYDLRSGQPDALDQIVATTFANVAMDLLAGRRDGRMVAIRDGKYAETSLPDAGARDARRVDVAAIYNVERFRPRYDGRMGQPLLLVGALGDAAASRDRSHHPRGPTARGWCGRRPDMSSSPWPGRRGPPRAARRAR